MRAAKRRGRNDWYHRMFAALLEQFNHEYEPMVDGRKRELFSPLAGTVIEVGAGTGVNLKYLGPGVEWRGVDPNPHVERYVRRSAARAGVGASFQIGVAEHLPVPDQSADAVISTLVLCSVDDPRAALGEIERVLKPGGRFVFIEHIGAPEGTRTRRIQNWVCPLWRRLADGCRPNRETWRYIEEAGFTNVDYERFRLKLPVAGPHIAGVARKA